MSVKKDARLIAEYSFCVPYYRTTSVGSGLEQRNIQFFYADPE